MIKILVRLFEVTQIKKLQTCTLITEKLKIPEMSGIILKNYTPNQRSLFAARAKMLGDVRLVPRICVITPLFKKKILQNYSSNTTLHFTLEYTF